MITMQYYALLNCTCDVCDKKNFEHFNKLSHTQSKKTLSLNVLNNSGQFLNYQKNPDGWYPTPKVAGWNL